MAALLVLTLWVGTLAIVVRDNTSRVIYNASSPSFAVSSPPSFNVFGRVVTDNPDNSTDAIAVMTWPCAESDAVYIARQCQLARCRALIFVNGPVLNDLMAWRFRGLPSGLPVLLVNDVDAERALRLPFAKATVDSSHVNKVRILLDSVWYRCLTLTVVVLSVIDLGMLVGDTIALKGSETGVQCWYVTGWSRSWRTVYRHCPASFSWRRRCRVSSSWCTL